VTLTRGVRTPPWISRRDHSFNRYVKSFSISLGLIFGVGVYLAMRLTCYLHVVHGVSIYSREAKSSPLYLDHFYRTLIIAINK
jgi:hypothetical protein